MKTSIETKNGVKYVAVNGEIIDTLAFKSFRPTLNNVSDFYKAGVRIFHVYCSGLSSALKVPYSLYGETWFDDKKYDFTSLDEQIEMFMKTAPEAYVFINVHLDVRQWWLDQNPGRPNSFTHLSQIAADEKWRKDTADYLKALIEHTEEKYDDVVLGYFLLGGFTTEWFSHHDHEESHPIKLKAFREYMNDPNAEIPSKEELEKPQNQIFLDPQKDENVIQYRKFHHELIADLVLYYARAAQEVLDHKKVVGLFFGYILELLDERIWEAGHLESDRVYRSDDIDLIATPSSYQFRQYDDATAYMLLCDTIEINDKMYFDSFDHMTFLVPELDKNERRICGETDAMKAVSELSKMRTDLLRTREQTVDGMRREVMQRLARRTGMWWFDMLEGWFYDDGLMEEIGRLCAASKKLLGKERKSNAEIAVFVSCDSLYYVNKCSEINTELICNQRDALARMGAPYDIYSLNDIERVDKDRYKVIIFLDAFYFTPSQREFVNTHLKRDNKTLLFISGADCISSTGFSKTDMEAMIEMNLSEIFDEKTITAENTSYGYKNVKNPTWCVEDENAETVGRFAISRKCGFAKKKRDGYTVWFSGVGNMSAGALRRVVRDAGVFMYTENDVPVYTNTGVLGIYNTKSEFTPVNVLKDGEFVEIFSGKTYKSENGRVLLPTGECPAQMLIIKD